MEPYLWAEPWTFFTFFTPCTGLALALHWPCAQVAVDTPGGLMVPNIKALDVT